MSFLNRSKQNVKVTKKDSRSKTVFTCKIKFPGFLAKTGFLCLHCGDCSLKATTLESQHVYNEDQRRTKRLANSEDVVIGEFVVKRSKSGTICSAPVLNGADEDGYVILYGSKIQRIELESNTFSNCYLTIYDTKKMRKRKYHWLLSDVFVTVDTKQQRLIAQYQNSEETFHILIPNLDDFKALYYLLSRNRELTESEQLQRVRARYPSEKHIEKAFEKLVLRRIMPQERASYMELAHTEKVMTLCKYGEMVAVKTLSDYIYSLRSPNIGKEVSFLTGAIIDEDSDWVASFIEELGIKLLIDSVLNQRNRRTDFWDISQCALECVHAIVNKQLPEDSISSLQYVVDNSDCVFFIVINFDHPLKECRTLVFQLVQVFVFFCAESNDEDGFENIIDAMDQFAREKKYKSKWDIFVTEMDREMQEHEIDISYLTTIVSLVNLIIGQPYFSNEERIDIWRSLDCTGFQNMLEEIGIDEEGLKYVENSTDMHFVGDRNEWLDVAQAHSVLKEQDESSIPDLHETFDRIYQECQKNGIVFELMKILSLLDKIPSDFPGIWRTYIDAVEAKSSRSRGSICGEQAFAMFDDYAEMKNVPDGGRRLSSEEVQSELVMLEKSNKKLQRQVENLRSENKRLSGDWSEEARNLRGESREDSPPPRMPSIHENKTSRERSSSFGNINLVDVEVMGGAALPYTLDPDFVKNDPPKQTPREPHKGTKVSKSRGRRRSGGMTSEALIAGHLKSKSSSPSQTPPKSSDSKIDPALEKYLKMLKMRVPRQSVMNKMSQDGVPSERIAECEALLAGKSPKPTPAPIPQSDSALDPALMKYVKMLKMKIPRQSVLNKMKQDGHAESRITECEAFIEGKPIPKATAANTDLDPALQKYVKMLKMNIPRQSVLNKMKQDGHAESRIAECEAFIQGKPIPKASAAKADLDPALKKYVKMLKMNIPRQSVLNKMKQEGHSEDRIQECEAFIAGKPIVKKSNVTPKKPKESKYRNSAMWKSIHQLGNQKGLEIETAIFEKKKKQDKPKAKPKPKPKKKTSICLIQDGKKQQRLQFFQAALKRDKVSLKDLQKALWSLECKNFDIESLLAVLPDEGEMDCVRGFSQSYELLDDASKLYFFLKNIPEVRSRTELLLYTQNFDAFLRRYEDHIILVQNAIHGIKDSTSLRMMFHMILKILQINDKNGRFKDGFPLRSLYTVCKRKLVDENMTWLQYIVNMFHEKDETVLDFVTELRPLLSDMDKHSNLDALKKDINSFALQLRRLKGSLKRYKKPKVDPGCKDQFIPFFTKFLDRAENAVLDLQEAFEKAVEDCKSLATDLGEPPLNDKRINTSYIQTISTFVDETKKSVEMLQRSQEKIRRRARIKEREKAKKRDKGKKRTVDQVADMLKTPSGGKAPGVMEQSLKKIKQDTKTIREKKAPSGYARARGLTMDGTNDVRAGEVIRLREAYRSAAGARPSKNRQSIDQSEEEEVPKKHGRKERGSIDLENERPKKNFGRYLSDNRLARKSRKSERATPGHRHKLSIHDLRCLEQSVDLVKMRRTSRAQKLSCSFSAKQSSSFLLQNPERTF